jgi:hypothetical protein
MQDLMTEINICFSSPCERLQLFMLFNMYTSQKPIHASISTLSAHPLIVLLNNSSTVCKVGLTVLVKLIPIFVVYARENLKQILPQLLAILVPMITWTDRAVPKNSGSSTTVLQLYDVNQEEEVEPDQELRDNKPLHVRPNLGWERLESTSDATNLSAPSPRSLFTILHHLFPRTTLRFLRESVNCLAEWGLATPYTVSWEEALDEYEIRSKSEVWRPIKHSYIINSLPQPLAKGHILHPTIIWGGTSAELIPVASEKDLATILATG